MPFSLTRRVTFSAAHRYHRPDWSDDQNARVFGLCARPNGHGHTYVCDVTVEGALDPRTGFAADLALLDRVLAEEVRERFDHRNLNLDIPAFAEGRDIPTSENLAALIGALVQARLPQGSRVTRVRVSEEPSLWVDWTP